MGTLKFAFHRLNKLRRHARNRLAIRQSKGSLSAHDMIKPVWPLPRSAWSDEDISSAMASFPKWHYDFAFEGGPSVSSERVRRGFVAHQPNRPLKRFDHFMPALLRACGGSLKGKRVLDMACNSGFWSIQCALLGAREVVGFDARQELIDQASLVSSISGIQNISFRKLDLWDMSPEILGGTFDVVLNLGVLYHVAKPLEAMELTRSMAHDVVVLDTAIDPSRTRATIAVKWEEADDIGATATSGMVAYPSAPAIDLILRQARFSSWERLPLRSAEMPADYMTDFRATWLIHT